MIIQLVIFGIVLIEILIVAVGVHGRDWLMLLRYQVCQHLLKILMLLLCKQMALLLLLMMVQVLRL